MRKFVGAAVLLAMASSAFAAGGRWKIARDRATGRESARLADERGRAVKEFVLDTRRETVPASSTEVRDPKRAALAKKWKLGFLRDITRSLSAAPLQEGRLLLLQEETVIMPPVPAAPPPEAAADFAGMTSGEAEDTFVWATLYDDKGQILWTRKYGPLKNSVP